MVQKVKTTLTLPQLNNQEWPIRKPKGQLPLEKSEKLQMKSVNAQSTAGITGFKFVVPQTSHEALWEVKMNMRCIPQVM